MLIKSALVFLLLMAVIGMIGNALRPGFVARQMKNRLKVANSISCARCGRYTVFSKSCDCKKG